MGYSIALSPPLWRNLLSAELRREELRAFDRVGAARLRLREGKPRRGFAGALEKWHVGQRDGRDRKQSGLEDAASPKETGQRWLRSELDVAKMEDAAILQPYSLAPRQI